MGEFLKENYELADHRNEEKYKNWDSDYLLFLQAEANIDIIKETNIKKYASLIKNLIIL